MSIFEKATRAKLRFQFKGTIGVEDIWDLSLTDLDALYKLLMAKKKDESEGLLTKKSNANDELQLKISIVTHVFNVKLAEKNESLKKMENAEKKKKLLALLDRKENEAMEHLSTDEIKEMISKLD